VQVGIRDDERSFQNRFNQRLKEGVRDKNEKVN
jgi:hypothetical protein